MIQADHKGWNRFNFQDSRSPNPKTVIGVVGVTAQRKEVYGGMTMDKNCFAKGQTVYLLNLSDGRGRKGQIEEATVVSVGRKYITANLWNWDYKFDMEDDFREKSNYSPTYKLFISRDDALHYIDRIELEKDALNAVRNVYRIRSAASDEELKTIISIVNKYCEKF